MRKTLKPKHAAAAARRRLWCGTHDHNDSNGASGTDGEAAAYAAATSESYGFLNIFFRDDQLIIICQSEKQADLLTAELGSIAMAHSVLCGAKITQRPHHYTTVTQHYVTVTPPTDAALWTALKQDEESHLTRQTTPCGLIACIRRIKSSLRSNASASPSPAPA